MTLYFIPDDFDEEDGKATETMDMFRGNNRGLNNDSVAEEDAREKAREVVIARN